MSGTYQNTLDATKGARDTLTSYQHNDYKYWFDEWEVIRDCLAGEKRIKEMREKYLEPLDTNIGTEYETYLNRACFFNMTSRTVQGLVGTAFRKPPKVINVAKEDLENVTCDGLSFALYTKKLGYEVVSMGRVGVLVDMPLNAGQPYLCEYVAENIMSWRTQVIDGREELTYVLLREIVDNVPSLSVSDIQTTTASTNGSLLARYRVLLLDNGVYKQRVYDTDAATGGTNNPSFSEVNYTEIIPTKNGVPLNFIPFKIFGPQSPTPDVQKPPMLDIVNINLSHYRTSAILEHGRYNTALPVYWVTTQTPGDESEYAIGASVVWELGPESKAGLLEYYGTGLKSLVDGLAEKEVQIASLGGRLMGIRPTTGSENPDSLAFKQQSEMSILLNVVDSLSAGLTEVITWYLSWQRKSTDGVKVILNKDFAMSADARELRALVVLYQSGILPVDQLYRVLYNADYLDEGMTEEEFVQKLEDVANFPNQPDVEAQSDGFHNATDRMQYAIAKGAQDQADDQFTQQLKQQRAEAQRQAGLDDGGFKSSQRTSQFSAQNRPKTPTKTSPTKPTKVKKPNTNQ